MSDIKGIRDIAHTVYVQYTGYSSLSLECPCSHLVLRLISMSLGELSFERKRYNMSEANYHTPQALSYQ